MQARESIYIYIYSAYRCELIVIEALGGGSGYSAHSTMLLAMIS